MKRLLITALFAALCTLPSLAGEPIIQLSLEGLPADAELPAEAKQTPPLLLPTRLHASEGNRIVITEDFSPGPATLPGRSVLLEKTNPGGSCYLQFALPQENKPYAGVWKLRTRLLSAVEGQRGNLSFTIRSGKEIAYYLQISANGRASTFYHGGGSEPLEQLPSPAEPLTLEIVFDFDRGHAEISANGVTLASSTRFYADAPMDTLEIGIKGDTATRTFAIHELVFSQE